MNYPLASPAQDANLPSHRHIIHMTTYHIIPTGDSEFNIGVAGSDGARQTMLGFTSKEEAEAWIAQDKRRGIGATVHTSDGT